MCTISYSFLHASLWMHLTLFFPSTLPFLHSLTSPCLALHSRSSSLSVLLLSLSLHHLPSPPSSAHVDTSTVAFDVDPIDLDAEEPPESQGELRSSKGMSGSVTSPQANIHRLPFFKKVTLGAQDTSLTSPASFLHLPPNISRLWSVLTSRSPVHLSLTQLNCLCCYCRFLI